MTEPMIPVSAIRQALAASLMSERTVKRNHQGESMFLVRMIEEITGTKIRNGVSRGR
jgi:hypothetical protein